MKLNWTTVGPISILLRFQRYGPRRLCNWEKPYAPALLERGLITRSITVPGGFYLTPKGLRLACGLLWRMKDE